MTFKSISGYFMIPAVSKTKTKFIEEPTVQFNPLVGRRISGRLRAVYSFREAPMARMILKLCTVDNSGELIVRFVLEPTERPGTYNIQASVPQGYAVENS